VNAITFDTPERILAFTNYSIIGHREQLMLFAWLCLLPFAARGQKVTIERHRIRDRDRTLRDRICLLASIGYREMLSPGVCH